MFATYLVIKGSLIAALIIMFPDQAPAGMEYAAALAIFVSPFVAYLESLK